MDGAPLLTRLAPAIFLLTWSGGFAFLALGLRHAEPMTFLALRFALALAILGPLFLVLRPPRPRRRAEWAHLSAVGFLLQAVYFGFTYLAITSGLSAGTLALIVSLQPILVGLLAPRTAGERVSGRRWAGLAIGLLGAAMVIVARSEVEPTSVVGALCAVGALAGMTSGTLYEKRFGVTGHPVTTNLVQYAVGLAAILPLALALEDLRVDWTGEFVISLGYLVIGNSLISITLLLAMIRRGEASQVSALLFLVPPLAALIAWPVLGEVVPPLAWLGMAVAAVGVVIATRRSDLGERRRRYS